MQMQFESRDPDGERWRDVALRRLRFVTRRLAWLLQKARLTLVDINGPRGGVDKQCTVDLKTDGHGDVRVVAVARDWRTAIDRALARAAQTLVRLRRRRQAPRREEPLKLRHEG